MSASDVGACPQCAATLRAGARFCAKCGAPVEPPTAVRPSPPPLPPTSDDDAVVDPSSTSRGIGRSAYVGGAVALVVVAGVVAAIALNSHGGHRHDPHHAVAAAA